MADISLTDYSYFLNHFVESRKAFPFEKNTPVGSPISYVPVLLLVCILGSVIGMGILIFRMKCGTQKTGYFKGAKPVYAPAPHWAGIFLLYPGAGLVFWSLF